MAKQNGDDKTDGGSRTGAIDASTLNSLADVDPPRGQIKEAAGGNNPPADIPAADVADPDPDVLKQAQLSQVLSGGSALSAKLYAFVLSIANLLMHVGDMVRLGRTIWPSKKSK
jgi:hypothetical protein